MPHLRDKLYERIEKMEAYINHLIVTADESSDSTNLSINLDNFHSTVTNRLNRSYTLYPFYTALKGKVSRKWLINVYGTGDYDTIICAYPDEYKYIENAPEFNKKGKKKLNEKCRLLIVHNPCEAHLLYLTYVLDWVVNTIKHFKLKTDSLFPSLENEQPQDYYGAFNLNLTLLYVKFELKKALEATSNYNETIEQLKELEKKFNRNCLDYSTLHKYYVAKFNKKEIDHTGIADIEIFNETLEEYSKLVPRLRELNDYGAKLCEELTAHFSENVPDIIARYKHIKCKDLKISLFKRFCEIEAY